MKEKPPIRNAEATRERILKAALAEFSAYGIAGARVDRIAQAAGCNKNLIYIYFQDKDALFRTILRKHLLRCYEEYPFTPDDLPGYAAKVFDFAMANPDLMRLIAWSALEETKASADRAASLGVKAAALAKAQTKGDVGSAFPADFLLFAILSLATAWSAGSPFGSSVNPKVAKQQSALRSNIIKAVGVLTNAGTTTRTRETSKSR
jgi:AcrR family transcriptional regulator